MARAVGKVISIRGAHVTELDARKTPDDELKKAIIGPTGNLRAPTLRTADALIVGFNPDAYRAALKLSRDRK